MAKKPISQKRSEREQQENQALQRVFNVFLLGIAAGVIVYGVLVIALRILRAEDVRSIPKGEKLIKLLHLK